MMRCCSLVGIGVLLCTGLLSAAASACPIATGIALSVPVASAQVQIAVPSIAFPVAVSPIVAAPVVVTPPAPVVTSIAIPSFSVFSAPVAVVSSPVVEAIRIRSPRRFRTPVRSLLLR